MGNSFSFNSEEYDFWPLYNSIKKYYTIGIKKNQDMDIYRQYPGILELEKVLLENIGNKKTYQRNWTSFIRRIGSEIGKEVTGTTFGLVPSYSAFLILDLEKEGNRCNYKELHFSVSLLGKYYQIYGLNKTVLSYDDLSIPYQIQNLKELVVSPIDEYKAYFESVEFKITEEFKDYRLVPFVVGQSVINGLEIFHLDKENCSINMALFNDFLGFGEQVGEVDIRGDLNYGMDSWKK
ncbi:MAG: hypothetical protein KDD31_04335 [Muricauda sp.]|nr:hypothetical protein [Allomuricauda sp.]